VVLWSGFARMVNNEIIILGNDAELDSDIDPEEAQHAFEIAEANLSRAEGMKELIEAKLALKRGRIREEAINWIPPANWRQSEGFIDTKKRRVEKVIR
jgi:F0F1-type ATP synthase epsilon subunit